MLTNHFKLYEGYVNNTNKLFDELNNLLKQDKTNSPEYAELTRRFGWEFNGMRLHELYFENISNATSNIANDCPLLVEKINGDYGSVDIWKKDFTAVGSIRGIGWAMFYYDKKYDRLFNAWIDEHNTGHLSQAVPLVVMDVFEHAYYEDYGLNRPEYIKTFLNLIDWKVINQRLLQ
jgi:Fe-Mn family superoxide dismutase